MTVPVWIVVFISAYLIGATYFILQLKIKANRNPDSEVASLAESFKYELEIEKTINYFSTSLFGQNTVEDILWDVSKNCISRLKFEDCVIYIFNDDGTKLIQKAAFGPKNIEEYKIYNPIEIPLGKGIVGTVAQSGIHEVIHDTSADERYIPDDKYRYSELTVPIKYQGKVIGVIDSEHSEKHFFTPRHLQILTTIASLCANKIVKVKAEEMVHQRELKIAEMNVKLVEARLEAFRAQMKPHFIFNCMASIQECILTGDLDSANDYLSKFSKLLRMVLENSKYNSIELASEIALLKLYLELESVRFSNKFSFAIELKADADTDEIKIPTMMLQPFIENAIWHGLLHKEGERKLKVEMNQEGEVLFINITDNGIGRAKAALYKSKNASQSLAIKMIEEKLNILKVQNNNPQIRFELIDLFDDDNQPSGTKVIIALPIELI